VYGLVIGSLADASAIVSLSAFVPSGSCVRDVATSAIAPSLAPEDVGEVVEAPVDCPPVQA
jgi:hypothetical protein